MSSSTYDEIRAERKRQDKAWSASAIDLDASAWLHWIVNDASKSIAANRAAIPVSRPGLARSAFLRIAALCVEGIESIDRTADQPAPGSEEGRGDT